MQGQYFFLYFLKITTFQGVEMQDGRTQQAGNAWDQPRKGFDTENGSGGLIQVD